MAALAALLPTPIHSQSFEEEADISRPASAPSQSLIARPTIPPYGQRRGWRPSSLADYADGGSYPECHVAQYPLDMGKKKGSSGNTLALQVDSDGNVRYDAIAHQGQRPDKIIQSQFKDLVPLLHRKDLTDEDRNMDRPSEDEVQETADKTRAALEKLVSGKIKAAQPKNVLDTGGQASFIRYTPGQQNGSSTLQQRIIKMSTVVEDPLEPPRFKHKKIPRGPPSPPPPVLRSPPRKATAQEQKEWMIPPCISNWKNNKGFTIPLDKRLAADGRGLQDVSINDNFAKFSEALFVADRHAREEVRQRSLMQQKLAQKEKASKEENLRAMAQRAREERAGVAAKPTVASQAAMNTSLANYGSDSGSDDESDKGSEEDEDAARVRDQMRQEKRREREREMRMNNMGTEQRAKQLARQQNRDISEKIALGLAKPTLSKESMLDSRLFNQESLSGSFADEDSYNLYDRPLFHGSTAAAAIYKARGNITEGNEDSFGGGTDEGIGKALDNDRFGLGQPKVGFEGAADQEIREGPVQFEKDTGDVFGLNQFLDEAKTGKKRGLDTSGGGSRKRQQLERASERDWPDGSKVVDQFGLCDGTKTFMSAASGARTLLKYTGIPPSWFEKRPKLPSRNWLIFYSFTSSCIGLYVYDRRQCRAIRQEYIDKVKDFADETVGSMYHPRKVLVYGGRWPGDEDYDQPLKYFRKYVKPILVAAAVDYTMVGGKRLGDVAGRVAESIKAQRRVEAGLEETPDYRKALPSYLTPEEERLHQLEGGIMIIGRPTFKEFMTGLKRGWSEPLDKVDKEEMLAQELEADGRFDESDEEPTPLPPILLPPTQITSQPSLPTVPSLPPIALVPFTDLLGFTKIPLMIWQWFNRRHDVRNGAEAAYSVVMGQTRPFSTPLFSDITPGESDLEFDVACERWLKKSLFDLPKETEKAREKYYTELKSKLETARALARGTREPTKEETANPPPTEVELRAERLKNEKRWRGDLRGWEIVSPATKTAWDDRFRDVLRVYTNPK
ncbi:Transcriptional regulator Cwf13 [Mycena indigotica]|uniref:Mitochondrial import inner membrane translocase subunit TIM54 n=1 Tax=Mycena indigotica TaxID=2126181 RepID=A0A8H6SCE2_9AGAR|nr:Transcriptional regulator Cwf13 [Mycena indigotica]KAF7295285.1 Transcriptional regulator Cwf13 [Mycena indigotica]